MPTVQQTKADLKQQVRRNTGNVLKALGDLLDPNREAFNTLVAIESAFRRLQAQEMRGNIPREQLHTGYADITARTLSLIDMLEEEDILSPRLLQYEIYERILVVAKSEERSHYLRQFFPADYFRSVDYDHSAQPQPAEGYDIILYDDQPPASKGETDPLLLHYLRDTEPVVLYFGRHSPLVWEYPEKAYATNSVFSLHARIREMAEYLRCRRAYERSLE